MSEKYQQVLKNREKHVADRRYYCEDCDKAFQQKSAHMAHLKTKKHKINIGEIPPKCYRCDVCELTFGTLPKKWNHVKSSTHRKMIAISE